MPRLSQLVAHPRQRLPLCKDEFEEKKVGRQVMNVLNMMEFSCPFGCQVTFTYENRKRHFAVCTECTEQQKCPFCSQNISQMQNGLTWHVRNECEGAELHCPDCSINIYQMYFDYELLKQN